MSTEVQPWIKLPNYSSGYFLVLHTGLLFFWLYSRLISNSNPLSYLLPVSISGIIVGWIMHYFVGNYLDNKRIKNEDNVLFLSIVFWVVAIIVYAILIQSIFSWMQPPKSTAWMQQ